MPTINSDLGDILIISSKEIKYISKNKTEYFIDGEMLVSAKYDLAIYTDSLMYYEDYIKQYASDNIEYHEDYDERTGTGKGYIRFKKKYQSDISEERKKIIINRIEELCKQEKIKIEIVNK